MQRLLEMPVVDDSLVDWVVVLEVSLPADSFLELGNELRLHVLRRDDVVSGDADLSANSQLKISA